jgi:hypothetical protein
LFILIFISGVSYKHSTALSESTELLNISYKIQIHLERLLSDLKDAETGQRGYIITGDSAFLKPYKNARTRVQKSFVELKFLTFDNKKQQDNLDSLFQLIDLRFKYLEISLITNSVLPLDKDLLHKNMYRGKTVMDKIRTQIDKMNEMEAGFLKEHEKKYSHEIYFTPIITFIILLFSLLIFSISFMKINNDLYVLRKSNEDLIIYTESIKHAEVIGEFCTKQLDLETNSISYSDNLYTLLGCEPQSFEPTNEHFLKFVHPDDRHIVEEDLERINRKENTLPISYRIIHNDGELRFFRSTGKFITDNGNIKTYIGIIKDITQLHLINIKLEERNQDLERSISELESFNRVASHDLQEPLRKIQTFISRISEKESLNMSEAGKAYFEKILKSANQMRTLIDDLLLFSRANKTEKVFESADLTYLLEKSIQELSFEIEEKKAVIYTAQLPVLNVIPFQIQQLFINLIGNSLKYSKQGISPEIRIDCSNASSDDYPSLRMNNQVKYYKISVTDNGLGFEQQYAESIFLLFHRLHNKTEYPGSGIGLSICKKIVENHNGFIIAEGKPGIGSVFTFFLPA